jgi:hypothetical protein
MWLHVTAFSTFPFLFRRTGEGNFYRQHHQHRRFFYHGKHYFNSTATGKGGSFLSSSVLLDPTSRDTLDVLFLLSSLFSLLLFRYRFSFQLGFFALLRYEETRCDKAETYHETQNNKQRQKYIHKNCREDSMQVHAVFTFKPILSLSLPISVYFFFFFFFNKNKYVVMINTRREVKNVLLSIRHTIYESVYKTQTKRGKPLQKGIVIVQ